MSARREAGRAGGGEYISGNMSANGTNDRSQPARSQIPDGSECSLSKKAEYAGGFYFVFQEPCGSSHRHVLWTVCADPGALS